MCKPETIQTYILMKAFAAVEGYLTEENVKNAVSAILEPHAMSSIEELGPLTFQEAVHELLASETAIQDGWRRYAFNNTQATQEGMAILEGFVTQARPELVVS